ncbi:MAG: T9SS type A sorting domain-containing protein [Bacteroidetes bacterium]|nr:T9SS type A sorting domain-containing protein [Bacteroidota bacterium]
MIRWLFVQFFLLIYIFAGAQDFAGQTYGGINNDIGFAVCQTNDDGFLLAGTTRSYGAGSDDMYIVRLDKNGTTLWTKTYGWIHKDAIRSIISIDNGFILTGDVWDYGYAGLDVYVMKIDNSGNVIWDQLYGTHSREVGFKTIPSMDDGFLVLGHSRNYEPMGDLLLVKSDMDGNEIWRNNYGSEFDDYGFDLIQDNEGDIVMIGSKGSFFDDVHGNFKNSDADIYLIKTDEDGNEIWQKTYGGNQHDFGQVLIASEDGYYIFGSSQSNSHGSFDMLLIKTDELYNEVWSTYYGGAEYEYGMSMDRNDQGDLFLFGTTKSYGTNQSADFYLIKANGNGEEIWNLTIGGENSEFGHQVIATPDSGCVVIGQTNSYGEGGFDFLFTKVSKNGIVEYFINGIDSLLEGEVLVYPNPMRDGGRLKLDSNYPNTKFTMQIISLNGTITQSYLVSPPDYHFNTFNLPSGMYFYRIISEQNSNIIFKGKLVVQ